MAFVDRSRLVRVPGRGLQPRTLLTVIRYPAAGPAGGVDLPGAPLRRDAGRFPLIIFGHGFAVTPRPYAALLQAWARAGYVVAAPYFPLENGAAPGGPDESDLVNQPRDVSFLITRLLAAGAPGSGSYLAGALNTREVGVSGQSDGGETALTAAYDRDFLDRRIRAAAILSGAKIPGIPGFTFPAASPPLLATQGTADTVNPPSFTHAFFDVAPSPKFLLRLFGADHLGPYTDAQPQLAIVERVSIAFFDRYLRGRRSAVAQLQRAGRVPGVASLESHP